MKKLIPLLAGAALVLAACDQTPTEPAADAPAAASFDEAVTGTPVGFENSVTPSTNEYNEANGWAHATYADVVVGEVTVEFVSTRAFYSCFEYKIDDEAPTSANNGGVNYNPAVLDGLWDYVCRNNDTSQMTFTAEQYVDIRMVFGAERDERFDWTRFYVLTPPNKDECKDGDWEAMGFKNQGQCVRFVETGKDSRVGD